VDIQFADTMSGDTLIVMRDGIGRVGMGPPEQFISIHSRAIQQDAAEWDLWYSTDEYRLDRQMFAKTSSVVFNNNYEKLAITDMFVFPQQYSGTSTHIAMEIVVDMGDTQGINVNHRITVCGNYKASTFRYTRGAATALFVCDLDQFFQTNRDLGYVPVIYGKGETSSAEVVSIPTKLGLPLIVKTFEFSAWGVSVLRETTARSFLAADRRQVSTFPGSDHMTSFAASTMSAVRGLVRNILTILTILY
jgi:hypothetical protein